MEMPVVPFLICFPFLVSILMYCIRVNKIRNVIAYISAGAVMVATITLMVQWIAGGCESIELYYHVETLDRIICRIIVAAMMMGRMLIGRS